MMTHNLPPLRIGDSFRTGDIAFNLVVKPGSLAIEVVGTAYFLPEKDAKELELILEGSVSTTAFGIGGTANGLWHNPFGLCRELVLGPQLGLKIELSYAGGVPQNFALVAGGKWREMELQLALQVGPEPLLSFEMSNVDIGKIISMASDGELNAVSPNNKLGESQYLLQLIVPSRRTSSSSNTSKSTRRLVERTCLASITSQGFFSSEYPPSLLQNFFKFLLRLGRWTAGPLLCLSALKIFLSNNRNLPTLGGLPLWPRTMANAAARFFILFFFGLEELPGGR